MEKVEPEEEPVLQAPKRRNFYLSPDQYPSRLKDSTKILFCGDVMFDWGVKDSINELGYESLVEDLVPVFSQVDYRVINLETPVLKKSLLSEKRKAYVFSGTPEDLILLSQLDIDLAGFANNHSMDFGFSGVKETRELLLDNGISIVGIGENELEASKPHRFTIRENQFAIYSKTEIADRTHRSTKTLPGVSFLEAPLAPPKPKEHSILSIHWGTEYLPEPTPSQQKRAEEISRLGYDAIVGHHPHIPQGIQLIRRTVVVYSLGNCIFGSRNVYLNHNLIAILHYKQDKLLALELVPIFGKFQYERHKFRPLEEKAVDFLEEVQYMSRKLGTDIVIDNNRAYLFLE